MKNDIVKVEASLFTNGKKNNGNPVFLTKYYIVNKHFLMDTDLV
jgi:hypothetical protein